MNNEVKFDIYLCKDDFKVGNTWHFYVDEQGLWPRQAMESGKNLINVNIDYSILVSVLGQGYIRCLNNLTASGQGGVQLAATLHQVINNFFRLTYQYFDEILPLLDDGGFDLFKYMIDKDPIGPEKSLFNLFLRVREEKEKQSIGNGPHYVGYHFNDSNSVISYEVDYIPTAGTQFAAYLAMFKILMSRIHNPYAFATLNLFFIITTGQIDKFNGYDSLEKMKNITVGTCRATTDYMRNPQGDNKILLFMKSNPTGFMLMDAGIPEFK